MRRTSSLRLLIYIAAICTCIAAVCALTVGDSCATPCDCYKRSSTFDTTNAHLCFDCSALHNQTCQISAICARGYICSIDPNSRVNEYRCLLPDESDSCVSDRDCHRSNYYNRTQQAVSYMGHCLPNGKCRYVSYGIAIGERGVLDSAVHTFEHSTCQLEAIKCKSSEDCFNLKHRDSVIGISTIMCEKSSGQCVLGLSSAQQQQQQRLPPSPTEGIVCLSEIDCENHAASNDPNYLHNCYACINAVSASSLAAHPTKVCVKTNTNCSSGMCLHGQCLAKQCQHHVDCLEVGGVAGRHCHKCDPASHLCTATYICPYDKYCVADFGEDRRCSGIVKECRINRNINDVFREAGGSNRFCVPTSAESGYYRRSNFLHSDLTQRVLDSLLLLQSAPPAAAAAARRDGEALAKPSVLTSFQTASSLIISTPTLHVAPPAKLQEDLSMKIMKKEAEEPLAKPIAAPPVERGVAVNRLGVVQSTNSASPADVVTLATSPVLAQEQPQMTQQPPPTKPLTAQADPNKVTAADTNAPTSTPASSAGGSNGGYIAVIVICSLVIVGIVIALWKLWETEQKEANESKYTKDFEETEGGSNSKSSSSSSSSSGTRRNGKPKKEKRLAIQT